MYPKKYPIEIATLLTPFIVPANSMGDISLTVIGVIEQKKPTHAPWISLPTKRVFMLGKRTRIPAKMEIALQRTKF
jgi:hypothetical protein